MASVRELASGKFELTLRSKKLLGDRRLFFTFDSRRLAEDYGEMAEKNFRAGQVPPGLLQPQAVKIVYLRFLLNDWIDTGKPAPTDIPVLKLLVNEVGGTAFAEFNYAWCEAWVQTMKLQQNLSPGTIRKRIGSLSRCMDWHLRSHPELTATNHLTLLPRGSATYTRQDAKQAQALDLDVKVDVERNRRLMPGEDERLRSVLAGVKQEGRQRSFVQPGDTDMAVLYALIVDTGLRLREAYTLTVGQVDLSGKTLRVQCSKQRDGKVKWRDVPLKRGLHAQLGEYLTASPSRTGVDLVFPFWDGHEAGLTPVKSRLSARFSTLFDFAGCLDIVQHDLRHEATCRWFELRRPDGQWVFRESEIHKIMGWAPGSRMGARYASFRAEDLAARLW